MNERTMNDLRDMGEAVIRARELDKVKLGLTVERIDHHVKWKGV
jgi:hypothetical protein